MAFRPPVPFAVRAASLIALASLVGTLSATTMAQAQQPAGPQGMVAQEQAAPVPVTPKTSIETSQFRRLALMARYFDYESGRLALDRSRRRSVKAYAASLVQDFRADFTRLTAGAGIFSSLPTSLPADLDAPIPPFVDDRRAKMLNQLASAEGSAFDRLFMDIQAGVQDETMNLYATYIQSGDDPTLVAYARDKLPVLQARFEKARRMSR